MFRAKMRFAALAMAISALFLISGCASYPTRKPSGAGLISKTEKTPKNGWWYARYRITWPEDVKPFWFIDLVLADRVVSPVLERYGKDIQLWRFHRRAVRDQAGHQFSFIFFATPQTANQVFHSLKSNPVLNELKETGWIVRDSYDNTKRITRPGIAATSDPNWSVPVQDSWPYYIMGVSRMWLNLVSEIADRLSKGKKPSSLNASLALYQRVNEVVNETWQEEGRHAFLHHLDAIFGYEPVVVYEKRLMRF